jgi:hypothetical protein
VKRKPPVLLIVIALNLVALVALAFVYPHLMVSPGPLVKGHAELATDCFCMPRALARSVFSAVHRLSRRGQHRTQDQ